jgi:hypothetical protein
VCKGNYHQAQDALVASLGEVSTSLGDYLKKPFKYRLVSQAQAAPVERAYFLWTQSGSDAPPPFSDAASIRAAIYNQAAAARQLEAFLHVARVSTWELCEAAIQGFEVKVITVPYMMLRSLIERVANVAALAEALRGLPDAVAPANRPSKPLLELGDKIGKALYGTKVNWEALRDVDLRSASKEQVAYAQKELTLNVSARSVLGSVDSLEKRVPGVRIAYDVLCEFLHPNVGDLFATTVRGSARLDDFLTRHVVREIGLGPKDLTTNPDLDAILSKTLPICRDAVCLLPIVLGELQAVSLVAISQAKKFAHIVRKKYRTYFRNSDLCPCLSGLKVRDCK